MKATIQVTNFQLRQGAIASAILRDTLRRFDTLAYISPPNHKIPSLSRIRSRRFIGTNLLVENAVLGLPPVAELLPCVH